MHCLTHYLKASQLLRFVSEYYMCLHYIALLLNATYFLSHEKIFTLKNSSLYFTSHIHKWISHIVFILFFNSNT